MSQSKMKFRLLATLLLATMIAGCGGGGSGGSSSKSKTFTYSVSLTNLTNAQPMSPVVVVIHRSGYSAFEIGTAASVELEKLAEGGDGSALKTAASADNHVIAVKTLSTGVNPGETKSLSFSVASSERQDLHVTLLSMLTDTNDGFTGVDGLELKNLGPGGNLFNLAPAYDAGTEKNTESAATVPGPAAGGTGFSAARNDVRDIVTLHPGVVSADDGLSTSALSEAYRFDNPVLQISVTRTQ